MNIFLLDKNLIVCNVLSSEGDVNSSPFFNDVYTQYLETGAETFEFETLQSDYLEIGNYVAFQYKGESKLFQIIEVTDEHEISLTKRAYCETAGLELNYEVLRPREIASASIGQYLENVLSETDWELGNVDDNVADVYTINIENYETVYDDIQEKIKLYDCEIAFRVEIKNNKVVGKYIDVYKKRGSVTNYRFEYGVNLEGVVRKVNASELVTALIGVGKDGESIKKAEWKKSDGDPVDKPVNQDFVEDEEAFNLYNNNGSHLMGYYECDLESPYDILEATYKELKKRSTPKIEYEIESSIFDMDDSGIGDEVYVIDNTFTPNPLHLSARVNEAQLSFTDKMKNKIKFANYKNVKSKITDEMRNIANTLDRLESSTTYGISRGGFLNSELITNGFDILVKNKYLNSRGESYYLDIRKKNAEDFMINKTNSIGTVTQSFAIDFIDNHVYAIQLEDNKTTGNLVLSKMDFNGSILGKMYLKAFGHGNQIGLDRLDGEVKIWVECDGEIASGGSFSGKKICRFDFENGVTYQNHGGNVYDLAPKDSQYVTVAVNEESDRLTIRYKSSNGRFYYSTYSLNSVLINEPRIISNIQLPSDFNTSKSPNQGFAVLENYIYNYQGFGYDQTNNKNNTKISVISLKGDVIYSYLVSHAGGLSHREPEGLFIKKSDTNVELYFGFASGTSGARKINIYKYSDVISSDYELKGKFIHNNGYTSFIDECVINTKLDGSLRRSSFLIYTDTLQPNFAIARVKNGQLYVNNLVYTPSINDAIIAEIQEASKGISLNVLTTDIELLNGQDGKTSYTWVKYSDNKMGSPMYDEPQDSLGNFRKYMGISYDNESPQEGTNPNDYTWIKVVGEDGLDGDNPLIANLTNDSHSVPTDSDGNNGNYSGCYSKIELFKGEEKITSNVIYSYSASSGVTGNWNSTEGIYTVTNMTVEAGYVDLTATYGGRSYTKRFTIIKNKQGEDAYTINLTNDSHAFSAESNGNITSTLKTTTVVTAFKGTTSVKPIIGTLPTVTGLTLSKSGTTITIQANTGTSLSDSGSFDIPITVDGHSFIRTFSWVKVKKGTDGISITTVDVEYAQSQSATTVPIDGWTTTAPEWSNGKYIWSRTKTILSTGGVNYTSPVCITGQQGNNGTGIESITEEYYLSTSKTTQTGGSWVTTPPTWSTGKYIWTRSKIVYKNPSSTVYTPAVCDTSWEAVNEIEIGGKNLFLGTKDYSGSKWSGKLTSTFTDGNIKYKKIYSSASSSWTKYLRQYVNIDANTDYVMSALVRKNTDEDITIAWRFDKSYVSNKSTIITSKEWTRVEFPISNKLASSVVDEPIVLFVPANSVCISEATAVDIAYIKFEKGNKATDWTPAPEDVDNAIGKNINTVDVMYYLSTSSTSLAGGSWSTTAPQWVNGKYMWSKTVTTLANGTTKESSPTCIAGAKGDTGNGVKSIIEQYYLSTSQTSLTGGSWSTTAPTWQQGKYIWTRSVITYTDGSTTTTNAICVSGSKGDKGDKGDSGTNGVDGTSPILLTISGQQSMKYLESNTPPVPSTSRLTADLSEGNTIVSSNVSYLWQYKNSSGSWGNLSGTNNAKTYSLSYTNGAFVSDVAQIRVAATYKSKTYYTEFTVTKIYDNKYITQEEIFNKLTDNGQEQGLYMQDGKIYLNMTYAKTGKLVADLIRGGVLTLGGESNSDGFPVNGYMRVLGTNNQELAVLDGGDMTINGLSSNEAIIDTLYVNDIRSPKIPPAVTENTTIYVNQTTGNDDAEFDNGAVYKTVQGAIDATPKNLNGFDVYIRLQGTSSGISIYSENLTYKGFYGGSLYTYLQKNYIHGYIVMRDCSARLSLVGGSNYDEIPDGASESARANIKPASLYTTGNTHYVICAINCTDVYLRALDLWGSTATNSNGYPNYAIGVREGSNVFVRNVKIHSSTNGFHAQVMGRLFAINTYGKVTNYAYRCTYGGWMNIGSGNSVSGGSSSLNISTGDGCQVLQGNITWDGSSSTGTNDNTTVNSSTVTYNATSGDSWKVKYSSWRKDNTVRQGDWSGTGMHKGCWFFGSQFNDIKGKTIKSIKLTIQRQSAGGNSGAVAFTLKMHNHAGRPSGAPSYLSGWSKNVSLSIGQSSTITITDSAVLTAIKNGTMKGFGIEVSSTSNSYYGILSPKLKAVVTYS